MASQTVPASTQWLKLVGSDVQVPVRSLLSFKVLRYIRAGELVQVKITQSQDSYRLADDSVRYVQYCPK